MNINLLFNRMTMLANKSNDTIRECFRRRNKDEQNERPDSTKDLSFIPSWNKEFLYLLGLEEVVQFRVEHLDKITFVPDKCGAKGKQKKSPVAMPAPPRKDPFTCAQCNTDFSSSWKQDVKGSILCRSCFQCTQRKEHWTHNGPEDSHIMSTFDNFSSLILPSTNHPVHSDPQVKQESRSSALVYSGQMYPLSLHSPSFYSSSSSCCSSTSSTGLFSSPVDVSVRSPSYSSSFSSPRLYSDSSSYCSSLSSDIFSSPIYVPSNSGTSSPSDGSSSLSLPSTSDFHSLSPKELQTDSCRLYCSHIPLTPLCKDNKVSQEINKEKNEHSTGKRLQWEEKKTGQCVFPLTPTCSSLNSAGFSSSHLSLLRPDKPNLQKPHVYCSVLSLPSKTLDTLLQSQKMMPSLKKTTKMELINQTMFEKLRSTQENLHTASSSATRKDVSIAPGSPASSHSGEVGQYLPKVTIHHVPSPHSPPLQGNKKEKPQCCQRKGDLIMSAVRKSELLGTQV